MSLKFETAYTAIWNKLDEIDPIAYASTRNYIDGAVTCLSPYISRGVISTKQVLKAVLEKGYNGKEMISFIKELCWRDYFQRVAQIKDLNSAIKQNQEPVFNHEVPQSIINASTGIEAIDNSISQLYESGYMHNHCRMYVAMMVCNIAKSHWYQPAQWMYYHLLDGDWASNTCSWQWVAGANSNKKYYANQENINKYTYTNQRNTYLDITYEEIETIPVPAALMDTQKFIPSMELPPTSPIVFNPELPTFIYNYYNLDPIWHQDEPGNRILLIEPDFFEQYPVSKKCINFMLALSKNIRNIQIYYGSFQSFTQQVKATTLYYKEHPLNVGYIGTKEERDWIADDVVGYYPSFFAYWQKVEKQLKIK